MDLENLADSKDSDVNNNFKNNVKRANLTCTIENFSNYGNVFKPCGKYFRKDPYSSYINYLCKTNDLCKNCHGKKSAIKDYHIFDFDLDSKVKCSLYIRPNGRDAETKDYVSLFLQFKEFSCLKIITLFKFSILNVDEKEEHKLVIGVEKFDANKNYHYLPKFINKDDLFRKGDILLPNDRLTVCFEIFYLCNNVNASSVSETTHIEGPSSMFLDDMSRMLNSSRYCDCIIKVENHKINVHKCILDARSEVFRSMLKYKLAGPEASIIEMSEFRLEVVKEMVNYIYTGKSPRVDEMAIEMLEIAEKYKLEGLKLIATESLLNSLNVQNVCEYLEKGEIYSAEILKEFAIRYIYLNGKEVLNSESWSRIATLYPLLLARIFNVAVRIE
uniref:BTB domain-containing protein n=1 Tax=Strongyloides papillosus TaxID=174720 RepID=A0A0N5B2L1_STREA